MCRNEIRYLTLSIWGYFALKLCDEFAVKPKMEVSRC